MATIPGPPQAHMQRCWGAACHQVTPALPEASLPRDSIPKTTSTRNRALLAPCPVARGAGTGQAGSSGPALVRRQDGSILHRSRRRKRDLLGREDFQRSRQSNHRCHPNLSQIWQLAWAKMGRFIFTFPKSIPPIRKQALAGGDDLGSSLAPHPQDRGVVLSARLFSSHSS